MNTKRYLIIWCSSFGAVVVGSIIGGILESSGTVTMESIDPKWVSAITMISFALFCVMCFATVPLAIRFFIVAQIKIGNGEFFLVKWFQAHERTIVYCAWGMLILGMGIAFGLAGDDILGLSRQNGTVCSVNGVISRFLMKS
jgi:hypothetical protein